MRKVRNIHIATVNTKNSSFQLLIVIKNKIYPGAICKLKHIYILCTKYNFDNNITYEFITVNKSVDSNISQIIVLENSVINVQEYNNLYKSHFGRSKIMIK